jgi:AraC-like DNA-binding protein
MCPTRSRIIDDARIPGDFVRLLFDYLEARGIDAAAVLRMPKPPRRERGIGSYSIDDWTAMLERAQRHLGDPLLGLHLGQTATVASFGLLGYLMFSSNTLGEAIARGARYWRLFRPYVTRVSAQKLGDSVVIEFELDTQRLSGISAEAKMAALAQLARNATGEALKVLELSFAHAGPEDRRAYDEYFGCEVKFGQPGIRARLPAACLAMPLLQPDADLVALLENQADSQLAKVPRRPDLEQTVRRCIAQLMPAAEPTIDQVAELLHLSPRTLQRRLDSSNLNFRALLDDTRRRLAESYLLESGIKLKDVAHRLGYSEQSAFSRAFRRWTGVSPGEFLRSRGEKRH